MDPLVAAMAFSAVLGLSALATASVLQALEKRGIVDQPNERSSHEAPTPRGGGLAVIGVLVPSWIVLDWLAPASLAGLWWILAGALVLAAVSWLDDLKGLSPWPRLAGQAAAVAAAVATLTGIGPVFQGLLPPVLDSVLAGLLWLWIVNLFNFMDGVDGITGAETACIGLGLFALTMAGGLPDGIGGLALTAAAAAIGFLAWNWPPARIFLGDVGSIPLGYLMGWLLLRTAAEGYWAVALILPLYYLADATVTLAGRLLRGQSLWRGHREHFYQRGARAGLGHEGVVLAVIAGNIALVLLAFAAVLGWTWPALAAAVIVVALLLYHLGRRRNGKRGTSAAS